MITLMTCLKKWISLKSEKTIVATSRFRREIKRLKKQNKTFETFREILIKLKNNEQIAGNYKPHRL